MATAGCGLSCDVKAKSSIPNGFIGCGAERVLRCDGENAVGKS